MAGLEDQTSGDILVDDELVNQAGPRDRDLAMVFQRLRGCTRISTSSTTWRSRRHCAVATTRMLWPSASRRSPTCWR
ncbi:hypothetical protein [Aeromicrobium sp. UC242_57]|uniref:hypothetical protein n=1 Tax=Aeromicrobium sp. UC242_57 TaxID=3374624 RepID=UPI0037BD401E